LGCCYVVGYLFVGILLSWFMILDRWLALCLFTCWMFVICCFAFMMLGWVMVCLCLFMSCSVWVFCFVVVCLLCDCNSVVTFVVAFIFDGYF